MIKQKTIEQRFKLLTPIEHVLKRPGRYLGSVKPHTAECWLVTNIGEPIPKMQRETVTWNPGLLKMFDEIISNSVDHSKRPQGKHLDTIKVDINKSTGEITVSDNGGIPVEMHQEHKIYVPTLIFGHLLSGENFDDDSDTVVTGQNGEGASLTNIFSTMFSVETCDGKKNFKQVWNNNMQASNPRIIEVDSDKGFTKISFMPDYARLETSLDDGNYIKIVKRVYDIAGCNPQLKIFLNGKRIQIKSFKDYIAMFTDKFEYDQNDNWQIGVAASADGFAHVSYVNTTETVQGGSHVYYIWYQIAEKLRAYIKKKHKVDVKPTEIQQHMRIFINATIVRPRYDSQTKENLITEVKEYKTSWEASDKFIGQIIKSDIIQSVLDWALAKEKMIEAKQLRELNKDANRFNVRKIIKLQDANLAGKEPERCILFLTEGDCIEESTLVKSVKDGIEADRQIKELRPDDLVLTHEGRYKQITNVAFSVKDSIKIKFNGTELLVSKLHKLLIYRSSIKQFGWIIAQELEPTDKLVRSTLINALHSEIKSVTIVEDNLHISFELLGYSDKIVSSRLHEFCVFEMSSLSYKLVKAENLDTLNHFLTFRDK